MTNRDVRDMFGFGMTDDDVHRHDMDVFDEETGCVNDFVDALDAVCGGRMKDRRIAEESCEEVTSELLRENFDQKVALRQAKKIDAQNFKAATEAIDGQKKQITDQEEQLEQLRQENHVLRAANRNAALIAAKLRKLQNEVQRMSVNFSSSVFVYAINRVFDAEHNQLSSILNREQDCICRACEPTEKSQSSRQRRSEF